MCVVGWRRAGTLRGKREEERAAEPFVGDVSACYPVRHGNESKYTRRFAGSSGVQAGVFPAHAQYLFAQNVDPLWASAVAATAAGAALMLYAATRRRIAARIALEPALRRSAGSVFPGGTHALQGDVFAGHSILERGHGNGTAIRRPCSHCRGIVLFKASPSKREGSRCGCVRGAGNVFACHAWQPLDHGFVPSRACSGDCLPLLPWQSILCFLVSAKEYGSVSVVACGLLLGGVVLYLGAGC